ncbi:hypothetical protein E2C01_072477 [Portunus trituberculatus]|uniref:Uncharacterized protein n=1 Tax=Portunus trituberculatus TaxID=210409 RepID=A0A5B7I7X8_PORTR|nr:hypothetical protein [Portunus trituberculatus]
MPPSLPFQPSSPPVSQSSSGTPISFSPPLLPYISDLVSSRPPVCLAAPLIPASLPRILWPPSLGLFHLCLLCFCLQLPLCLPASRVFQRPCRLCLTCITSYEAGGRRGAVKCGVRTVARAKCCRCSHSRGGVDQATTLKRRSDTRKRKGGEGNKVFGEEEKERE